MALTSHPREIERHVIAHRGKLEEAWHGYFKP